MQIEGLFHPFCDGCKLLSLTVMMVDKEATRICEHYHICGYIWEKCKEQYKGGLTYKYTADKEFAFGPVELYLAGTEDSLLKGKKKGG